VALGGDRSVTFVAGVGTGAVGVEEWVPMAANTGYRANSNANGNGTDRTDDLSIITTDYATSRLVTVLNCSSSDLYITLLQARGRAVTETAKTVVEVRDEPSIDAFGERTYLVSSPFIHSSVAAESYGNVVLAQYKEPHRRVEIDVELSGDRGVAQSIDLSDKVTLRMDGVADEMFVEFIAHQIERGRRHNMSLLLAQGEIASNLLILGTGRLGTGVLGR